MPHSLRKVPIPLLLALAVAVGVTVTIYIQISILPPPPAVVAPIETSVDVLETCTSSVSLTYSVVQDTHIIYPTLAGLGKLQIETNTTGWYYLPGDLFVALVRRSPGNATFTIGIHRIHVREINNTHAFILYRDVGIVARKVQVGASGWIVYHPVVTAFEPTTLSVITRLLSDTGASHVDVFQPREDYLLFDATEMSFKIYADRVNADGVVQQKHSVYTNNTNFTPLPTNTPVTINRLVQIDAHNYALFPVWSLFYFRATVDVVSEFKVTPAR